MGEDQEGRLSPLLEIALDQPEIPPNAGAVGRLCVNLGARLHLIEPLGFSLDEKMVRRAGLDYWQKVDLAVHASWDAFTGATSGKRRWLATPDAKHIAWDVEFQPGDLIVFGRESVGLDKTMVRAHWDETIALPMPGPDARTLNLACSASAIVYEALRQFRERGLADLG